MSISQKLLSERRALLDLSSRNRLISLPSDPRAKQIIVHDERSDQVWRTLVAQKKDMTFSGTPDKNGDGAGEAPARLQLPPPEDDGAIAKRHLDSVLQTLLQKSKLQSRLLTLYRDSRVLIEEQGVNVLYLALGALSWPETPGSITIRRSPLVLLPVELKRKNASENFRLAWDNEEPSGNISLAEKLKETFGFKLPEFNPPQKVPEGDAVQAAADEIDLGAYFQAVETAIQDNPGWSVDRHAIVLGFFSFAKFLMWRDLDPEKWPKTSAIDAQENIVALLGDGFSESPLYSDGTRDIDQLVPATRVNHVLDADGSQTLAIEFARRGRSMVIDGPPGTGKSQTIANIIASAVVDGKTVLFVAEKLAALNVVAERLNGSKIGQIALELHSNKAQKRIVLDALFNALKLQAAPPPPVANSAQRLDDLRGRLSRYADALHARTSIAGLTAFQAIGARAHFPQPLVDLAASISLKDAATWTENDLKTRRSAIKVLADCMAAMPPIAEHPWREMRASGLLPTDFPRLSVQINATLTDVRRLTALSRQIAQRLGFSEPATFFAAREMARAAAHLSAFPGEERHVLKSPLWSGQRQDVTRIAQDLEKLREAETLAGQYFNPSWSTIDFEPVFSAIKAHGRSWFRGFNKDFKGALAALKSACAAALPKAHGLRMEMAKQALLAQRLRNSLDQARGLGTEFWGANWNGHRTSPDGVKAALAWATQLDSLFRDPSAAIRLKALDASPEEWAQLKSAAGEVVALSERSAAAIAGLAAELDVDGAAHPDLRPADPMKASLSAALETLGRWRESAGLLGGWQQYVYASNAARSLGLAELAHALANGAASPRDASALFDAALATHVIRLSNAQNNWAGEFSLQNHERLIEEFREADLQHIGLCQAAVAAAHTDRIAKTRIENSKGLKLVSYEIGKKKRHIPLRKLFRDAGSTIQALKPVWLMSPLSVAQCLSPGDMSFDLLVMDEASQIEPVDALGAIARAKQIVVVGDEKQLPPTQFFKTTTNDEDAEPDDDSSSASDQQSVLALCKSKLLPGTMLRWHYRSRHESLIAVSNRSFYGNDLFIVPSPVQPGGHLGLKFHYCADGVFDKGASHTNRIEARMVAEAVMRHAQQRPEESLMAVAFSIKQRDAIWDELELLRRQQPEHEHFFSSHAGERFDVKNLENVQGDERDVVFISVGYAPPVRGGALAMQFGPLSAKGGERRLNVLISRSKTRCEVFSSIRASDIDLDRAKGEGVRAFKTFLRYAETGDLVTDTGSTREPDSAFETAVKIALEAKGYSVATQIGVAGFFVDLAIRDPIAPGEYLIGIECDGAAYHSTRSARDRDRLRQSVLEQKGWTIARVWSTDWFQQPDKALERLLAQIEAAKAERAALADENIRECR